jgi:hypothetical protein
MFLCGARLSGLACTIASRCATHGIEDLLGNEPSVKGATSTVQFPAIWQIASLEARMFTEEYGTPPRPRVRLAVLAAF